MIKLRAPWLRWNLFPWALHGPAVPLRSILLCFLGLISLTFWVTGISGKWFKKKKKLPSDRSQRWEMNKEETEWWRNRIYRSLVLLGLEWNLNNSLARLENPPLNLQHTNVMWRFLLMQSFYFKWSYIFYSIHSCSFILNITLCLRISKVHLKTFLNHRLSRKSSNVHALTS